MKLLAISSLLALGILPLASSHIVLVVTNSKSSPPPPTLPYRGNEFHANGKKFYVYKKPTNASCPPADSFACPDSTRTIFPQIYGGNKPQNLTLYSYRGVNVGAQQVYVADDYSLSFTAPNEPVPASAVSYGFSAGGLNDLITYGNPALDSYVCHNKKAGNYQVYIAPYPLPQKLQQKMCDPSYVALISAFGAFEYV